MKSTLKKIGFGFLLVVMISLIIIPRFPQETKEVIKILSIKEEHPGSVIKTNRWDGFDTTGYGIEYSSERGIQTIISEEVVWDIDSRIIPTYKEITNKNIEVISYRPLFGLFGKEMVDAVRMNKEALAHINFCERIRTEKGIMASIHMKESPEYAEVSVYVELKDSTFAQMTGVEFTKNGSERRKVWEDLKKKFENGQRVTKIVWHYDYDGKQKIVDSVEIIS